VFCECIQHRLRFCLDHFDCVKVAAFHLFLASREIKKSRVDGGRQSCYFWSKIPGWKRKSETVPCRDTAASSFFAIFHAELTVWPARTKSLRTILLMSKKIMSMLLTLLFTCLGFFGLGKFGLSVYGLYFLSRTF
jgi:hypothetical protein